MPYRGEQRSKHTCNSPAHTNVGEQQERGYTRRAGPRPTFSPLPGPSTSQPSPHTVLAMLLPLLLCLLPSALLPPVTSTRARNSMSKKCSHLHYWHQKAQACVPCETGLANHVPLHGLEFTVNCGMRDTGGRFATPSQECPSKSFNDGRFLLCQPCSQCPPGAELSPCTRLQDARCCPPGQRQGPDGRCRPRCCFPAEQCPTALLANIDCNRPAEAPGAESPASLPPCWPGASPMSSEVPGGPGHAPGSASAPTSGTPGGPESCSDTAASSPMAKPHLLLHPQSAEETSGTIAPTTGHAGLWGAPLQHLLDDADVLEELIMLLDPEGKAGGGTRHLAARYGLSATWIDYAYSLRSTRSPLRATLETVAARQPDATLGQLAGLLAAMGRKDALQVLEGVQVGV
ncbi:IGF-like family receptor 1 isoform X3 [Chrysemys picta bellii]|uniref:IGF-like family receptor 1 isoform X3 n=1 Tax=Chrysemys picta bellii TaxID=8478 RepID=UPI0032B2276F